MGIEALLHPFLLLASTLASAMFAAALRGTFGFRYRSFQVFLVAVAAPLIVMLLAMRAPGMVWGYASISVGLSAAASCAAAAVYSMIGFRK